MTKPKTATNPFLEVEPHAHGSVLASEILHELLVNTGSGDLNAYHEQLIWISGQLLDSVRETDRTLQAAYDEVCNG